MGRAVIIDTVGCNETNYYRYQLLRYQNRKSCRCDERHSEICDVTCLGRGLLRIAKYAFLFIYRVWVLLLLHLRAKLIEFGLELDWIYPNFWKIAKRVTFTSEEDLGN